jgi:hypothetical protein
MVTVTSENFEAGAHAFALFLYGQQNVVHIYNLKNRDTIEETVRSYFDQRLTLTTCSRCRAPGSILILGAALIAPHSAADRLG